MSSQPTEPELPDSLRRVLREETRPVRPWSTARRAALPLLAALTFASLTFAWARRPDLDVLGGWTFVAGIVWLAGSALAALFLVLHRGRHGVGLPGIVRWASLGALLVSHELFAAWMAHDGSVPRWIDLTCASSGSGLAVGITILVLAVSRRSAPNGPVAAGALSGAAGGFVAILALHLHCPASTHEHLAVWHAAPLLLGALAGAVAGRTTFRP